MKKLYTILLIVLLINIVGTVVLLILAPAVVPAHYNYSGEIDRMGSKYEFLIFPAITLIAVAAFAAAAKHQRKKGAESNEKVMMYCGICMAAFFTALGFYYMIKAIKYDPGAVSRAAADGSARFVTVALGALLVVLGNIMPKVRKNSAIGLRTKWSMANDSVWQKSQRFGGIACVICGLAIIILSLFVPVLWCMPVMLILIIIFAIVCTIASYRYYKAETEKTDKDEM